jgi:hypothetical protein
MQPGITVGFAINIEQMLVLDDDVDKMREWRKEVPTDEVPELIRELALAMLSKHASIWDVRIGQIDSVSHHVKTTGGPIFCSAARTNVVLRIVMSTITVV